MGRVDEVFAALYLNGGIKVLPQGWRVRAAIHASVVDNLTREFGQTLLPARDSSLAGALKVTLGGTTISLKGVNRENENSDGKCSNGFRHTVGDGGRSLRRA